MKKKIVLVMLEAPIPFGGAASRWYYILLKELIARGHEVSAFAAVSKMEHLKECRKYFDEGMLQTFLFPERSGLKAKFKTMLRPYSYMFSDMMINAVHERLKSPYDLIHLEQLWCAWTIEGYESRAVVSVHYLSTIDLEFTAHLSLKEKLFFKLLKSTERKLLSRFKYIKTCSPRLEQKIREWFPYKKIESIPFAIDSSIYSYLPDEKRNRSKNITLIASMNWHPGLSAAKRLLTQIWPEILRLNPDCTLTIVGWEARSALKEFLDLPHVSIYENVPDMQIYFENSSILVYPPARGSGMKIKILESMLYGIPVVTTSEGVEGLNAIHMTHAMIADNDSDLIKLTHELLNNHPLQQKLRTNARQLIETECSATNVINSLELFYSKIN